MFRMYANQASGGESEKIGHERFNQRPMYTCAASKKYRKRISKERKAKSLAQIDSGAISSAMAAKAEASAAGAEGSSRKTMLSAFSVLNRQTSTSLDALNEWRRKSLMLLEEATGSDVDVESGLGGDISPMTSSSTTTTTVIAGAMVAVATPPVGRAVSSSISSSLECLTKFFSGVFCNNRRCVHGNVISKSLFRSQTELIRQLKGADEERQHDRFNYRKPGVNYDKFPRPIRPRKSICTQCTDRAVPVEPALGEDGISSNSRSSGEDISVTANLCGLTSLTGVIRYNSEDAENPVGQDQLQSIAFTFSHLTMEAGSKRYPCKASGTLPPIRRQYTRYDYTALEDDANNAEKLEMEKKQPQRGTRGNALVICQYYLRTSGRYTYLEQLNDIGSRIDKYWFMVRDGVLKTDRMMTMVPHNEYFPIVLNCSTKKVLTELFLALQHPYIYPILDIDFKTMSEDTFVVMIFPFNVHGSLKDLIYRSNCKDEWQDKYSHRSVGLPEPQIQRIGRQLLEALLFLQDRGFPSFANLHSGNVIIQNGVARLTGMENTILGYTSRICPMLKKKLKDCKESIDTLCFGHVLFEMAAAYELNVAHPTEKHLQDIQEYAKVLQVLSFIFDREDVGYPTIEEVSKLDFFRILDLREMRGATSSSIRQPKLSQCVKNLLKEVKQHQKYPKSNKRSHSTSSLEMPLNSSPSSFGTMAIDSQGSGHGVSGLHRNISSSSSVNCLAVWENGDVRRHLSVISAHDFAQRRSCDSTPYSSMLDVSFSHYANMSSNASEEYHTPPTTPTVRSQLDVRIDEGSSYKNNRLNPPHPSNLLEHCFKKIHNAIN